jgi:hypothetical protein
MWLLHVSVDLPLGYMRFQQSWLILGDFGRNTEARLQAAMFASKK